MFMKRCAIVSFVSVAAIIVCENGITAQKDTVSDSPLNYQNPENRTKAFISSVAAVTNNMPAENIVVNVGDQKMKKTPTSSDKDYIYP